MKVHLVDGTYELFRSFFGAPPATAPDGREVGATRGILQSAAGRCCAQDGVTHVAAAFDHVIESFRNELYAGYKTGEGVAARAAGRSSRWRSARRTRSASSSGRWSSSRRTTRSRPRAARWADADGRRAGRDLLARQGPRAVRARRPRRLLRPAAAEAARRHGRRHQVRRAARVDPGLAGARRRHRGRLSRHRRAGARSAPRPLLARYERLEDIPDDERPLGRDGARRRRARRRACASSRADAVLFKRLATLRTDAPLPETLDDLRWQGARRDELAALCAEIGDDGPAHPHRPLARVSAGPGA